MSDPRAGAPQDNRAAGELRAIAAWSPAMRYPAGFMVEHAGRTWISTGPSENQEPGRGRTWRELAGEKS